VLSNLLTAVAPALSLNPIEVLLWSVFSNAEVKRGEMVGDFKYEWVVPEYRIALATETWQEDHSGPGWTEDLHDSDYRFVLVTDDLSETRNRIINEMNTIYVMNSETPAILTPRLTGDAGWDIITSQDTWVEANSGVDVPSDLFMAIPNHLYGIVQARSSTSKKRLIILPGVIDPAYRGRIYAMAYNPTLSPIKINKGDRIAQMLFMPRIPHLSKASASELSPTERGSAGFGSTGLTIGQNAK